MSQSALSSSTVGVQGRASGILATLAVGVFGIFLIYSAGFLHLDAVHNAAHDARHSFAFPCH